MNIRLKLFLLIVLVFIVSSFSTDLSILGLSNTDSSLSSSPSSSMSGSYSSAQLSSMSSELSVPDNKNSGRYVNESQYYIGAGDELTAFIWGTHETQLDITVTALGAIIIPTVGSFSYGNKTLAEIKPLLISEIKKRYKSKSINIFLTTIKTVDITVVGNVAGPKVYSVSGATRVSSAIEGAGGFLEGSDLRNVIVHNEVYGDKSVDVLASYRIASIFTPYVKNGDKIFVQPRNHTIMINGAVLFPNIYDLRYGDNVEFMISLAGGMKEYADSNRTIVTHFLNDVDSLNNQKLTLNELSGYNLETDDRLLISTKKDYRVRRQVHITGEVKFPGVYSIRKDKTTLIDIIGYAGGLTSDAFLRGSRIIRKDYNDAGLSEYNRLKLINYGELSPDEKSYLKYRNTDRVGAVSIDFQDFLNEDVDANNVILRSGDSIVISKRNLSVNVMGAVIKPGLVTYKEGASYSYYINEAGGYKSDAVKKDMRVIKGGSDIWLKPRQVENVEVGDAIWVPEKQYVDRLKKTRDILGIVGSIAAVVVASLSVAAYIDSHN